MYNKAIKHTPLFEMTLSFLEKKVLV